MKALSGNYAGSTVLIYDASGQHLASTVVSSHDKTSMRVRVQEIPPGLVIGDACTLLFLTSPAPCEYQGRIASEGTGSFIALYRGRVRENRGSVRYNVNSPAVIENLICDGKAYPLHTPLSIELINISKSGVRFRAQNNALSDGDRFQMRLKFSNSDKLLIADAIHHADVDQKTSEYGCSFLIGSEV